MPRMPKTEFKISVLTVTYGNRWQLLQKVLQQVLNIPQVTKIIVVNNASAYNVADNAGSLNDGRIEVINNTENRGSAGGYKDAISLALKNTDIDFIWLLDDDNLPEPDALSNLLYYWSEIKGDDDKKALFCLREDRVAHVKIAKGDAPSRYYLVPNNFLGFNVFRILKNQWLKSFDKFKAKMAYKAYAKIPYVPYGGLFMHSSMAKYIGVPDERFFVYVDDSEYTYRITQNGGTIWLIPSSKVVDIERSQGLDYKKKLFHSKLLDQWNFRTYYQTRNRMFFYSRNTIKSKLIFKINKAIYLQYLYVMSVLSSKQKEYRMLLQAVNEGLDGKLGQTYSPKPEQPGTAPGS